MSHIRVKDDPRVHIRNPYANPDAGVTACGVMFTVKGAHHMGRYGVSARRTDAAPTCFRCIVQGRFP